MIAAIEAVDAVISFDEETPIELIRRLKPDILVKGGDYTIETVVGAADVQEVGRPRRAGRSGRGALDNRPDPRDPGRIRARTRPDTGNGILVIIACW